MRNVVRSQTYARTRVGIGLVAAILGASIVVRTFAAAGLRFDALPAYVMGLAMVTLGVVRLRDYRSMRRDAAAPAADDRRT